MRVAYLESLLQQVRPDIALDHLSGPVEGLETEEDAAAGVAMAANSPPSQGAGHFSNQPAGPIHHALAADGARQPSATPSDDQQTDLLSSEVALLCLSAAGREPHYFGPSSAVSFSRIVSATMGFASGEAETSSQPNIGSGRDETWPDARRDNPTIRRSPSPSTGAKLTQAYFDNIHPQYPFLHQPTFKRWEEEFQRGTQSGNLSDVANIPLFFVLMVRKNI